jgi:D-glycero-alpha-D-manno-heptose-7-phosphate kinase
MIVARAPLRISFGGGGTDLPEYADRFGGLVLSAAISPACRVEITPHRVVGILLTSADYRCTIALAPDHPVGIEDPLSLQRAVLTWFEKRHWLPTGVRIAVSADVPPGSGLGSSSALTVAMVAALARYASLSLSPAQVAEVACEIEIDLLRRPIGRQDHYAAALGGLNTLEFSADGVTVTPLCLPEHVARSLVDHLLLFSTRRTRDSASVLAAQRAATVANTNVTRRLHAMKELARDMRHALIAADFAAFGALLDRGWRLKRNLSRGISSRDIDQWYEIALAAGAYGGKICGAGGGGHFLFCAPPTARAKVEASLRQAGLVPLPFTFDWSGTVAFTGNTVPEITPPLALKGIPA